LARTQRGPRFLSDDELHEFGRGEMVYGREADGGYEPRMEVVGQVQREYRGHGSVARVY